MAQFRDTPGDISNRERSFGTSSGRESSGMTKSPMTLARERKAAEARGETGAGIGKAIGSVTGIPFGSQFGGWVGGKIGENIPAEFANQKNTAGFTTGRDGSTYAPNAPAGQVQDGQQGSYGQFGGQMNAQLGERSRIGMSALEQQQALLGLGGQEAQDAAYAAMNESPGQKFLRDRQEKATLRAAAATGQLQGGNVQTALQKQAVGFAQQDLNNQFGRLSQLSGQGYQAGTAGLDEDYRYSQAAQATDLMNRQESAGKREQWSNIAGMFSKPIENIFDSVGDSFTDWAGW